MAKSTKRPLSLLQKNRTAIAPRNPLQKTMTAGTTQPGKRLSSDEGTRSASVSIVRKDSLSVSRAPLWAGSANRAPSEPAGGRTLDGASLSMDTCGSAPNGPHPNGSRRISGESPVVFLG
jgi:hypothetical protein